MYSAVSLHINCKIGSLNSSFQTGTTKFSLLKYQMDYPETKSQ